MRRRNSLRMAIQLWGVARSCHGYRDCTAHPTQKEETGGTAPLSSPSHIPQVHRRNSAHTEQSSETTLLASPSQLPPISFRGATKCWPWPQTLIFYRRGEFAAISMQETGGTKRIASLQLQAANNASVVSQNFTRWILPLLRSTQQRQNDANPRVMPIEFHVSPSNPVPETRQLFIRCTTKRFRRVARQQSEIVCVPKKQRCFA